MTQKQKRPKYVVDVKCLARMPKFQIESLIEIALSDRLVKVVSRISGLDQSMQASSVDLPRPIDTSTTVFDSTVVSKLNVHGVETLIGDDGKTYDLPLKVNLKQSRSRDKYGVVVNFDYASVQRNCIVKSYGDALKTSVRHRTISHVVFGNSNSSVMKGKPEVI